MTDWHETGILPMGLRAASRPGIRMLTLRCATLRTRIAVSRMAALARAGSE